MKTFYADDTYLKSDNADLMPRIHMLGGIVINSAEESRLIKKIIEVKKKHTLSYMPISWNFSHESVKAIYAEHDRLSDYDEMIDASQVWLKELAAVISSSNIQILISCIQSYSEKKEIIKESRQFLFENALMRLAIDARNSKSSWQCVLPGEAISEFSQLDDAYYPLLHFGETMAKVKIPSGPLEPLGFHHSLLYARAKYSPLLELADIIIGAARDHLESVIQIREVSFASEMIHLMKNNFKANGRKTPGYGVFAPGGNLDLKNAIKKSF